jgi:DNA-directed RNA polymerase subunit RPC12/RpoP
MFKAESRNNLRTLWCHGGPLGIECPCGRRAIVPPEALDAHPGNMRAISSLRFVCRECGSRAWTGWIFDRHDDALGWARSSG